MSNVDSILFKSFHKDIKEMIACNTVPVKNIFSNYTCCT